MTLTPRLRKVTLTAHVASSVAWLGAAACFLALAIAALASREVETVRAAYIAARPITWFVLVPLALTSLVTGIVQSLGTRWGLFRHYWVVFKLALTVAATVVLLQYTPTVNHFAGVVRASGPPSLAGLPSYVLHSGAGVLVLLVTTFLGVYKPRGTTPYGRRKEREGSQDD